MTPFRYMAPYRTSADAHAAHVDAAGSVDGLVQRGHEVDEVLSAPVADDLTAEKLAVSIGAARVDVQDHVAHPGKHLELVEERPPVLSVPAAGDLQDQRVTASRLRVVWAQRPALDHPVVGRRERVALRLGDVAFV